MPLRLLTIGGNTPSYPAPLIVWQIIFSSANVVGGVVRGAWFTETHWVSLLSLCSLPLFSTYPSSFDSVLGCYMLLWVDIIVWVEMELLSLPSTALRLNLARVSTSPPWDVV